MNLRIVNCRAFVLAQELLDLVRPCLREEEQRHAFEEIFAVCQKNLTAALREAEHVQRRLKPLES